MKLYIDNEYKCHLENDGTMREVEADCFGSLCKEYVEGCRYIPGGESWTNGSGITFYGPMYETWCDHEHLVVIQNAVDHELEAANAELEALKAVVQDMQEALNILEVTPDEEVE